MTSIREVAPVVNIKRRLTKNTTDESFEESKKAEVSAECGLNKWLNSLKLLSRA